MHSAGPLPTAEEVVHLNLAGVPQSLRKARETAGGGGKDLAPLLPAAVMDSAAW
jgi:hypothetical protein